MKLTIFLCSFVIAQLYPTVNLKALDERVEEPRITDRDNFACGLHRKVIDHLFSDELLNSFEQEGRLNSCQIYHNTFPFYKNDLWKPEYLDGIHQTDSKEVYFVCSGESTIIIELTLDKALEKLEKLNQANACGNNGEISSADETPKVLPSTARGKSCNMSSC